MERSKEHIGTPQEHDAIDSYFECITACSLEGEDIECVTRCVEFHLKEEGR